MDIPLAHFDNMFASMLLHFGGSGLPLWSIWDPIFFESADPRVDRVEHLAYLPTYLSNYLPTYLPTYLPLYLPTYLPTYLPYLPTLPTYLTYLPYFPPNFFLPFPLSSFFPEHYVEGLVFSWP